MEAPEVQIPILHSIELDSNVIQMNVKIGSKTTNLTSYAFKRFKVRQKIKKFEHYKINLKTKAFSSVLNIFEGTRRESNHMER